MAHVFSPPPSQTRHAIILAAGESTRTRPLTLNRPKPLIPLLGKPLLAHILAELAGLVDHVTLIVGYRAADIQAHFGPSYRGMALSYVFQSPHSKGTAAALLAVAAQATSQPPCLVLYGDNLISRVDILGVLGHCPSLAGLPVADPSAFGVLEVQDGSVQRIVEKPPTAPPGSLANPGIYHFPPTAFPLLCQLQPSPRGEYELTELIELLAQQGKVAYHACQGFWLPVGTPWEALLATIFLLERQRDLRSSISPKAQLDPSCTVEGMVQIGAATIGAGCYLKGPLVIGDGVTVGEGCTLQRVVLEPGASLGHGCQLTDTAVGAGSKLGPGCVLAHSFLDAEVTLGAGVILLAQAFPDLPPLAAATQGLLTEQAWRWRGAILAQGNSLPPGTILPPGTVQFPT